MSQPSLHKTCNIAISPAQMRRVVPVDGVTDTVVACLAAPLTAAGSVGGREPSPEPMPSLPVLQVPELLLTGVTVRQVVGNGACAKSQAASSLPPLHSMPPVTTASGHVQAPASAPAAAPSCSAAPMSDLKAPGRRQSAAAWVPMETSLAAEACCVW